MKNFTIILIIVLSVLGLIIWFTISQDTKNAKYRIGDNPQKLDPVGEIFENQGQTHIKIGESHPPYNSNPPTSGSHYIQPASWGIYTKALRDEQAVHNLEHGGIWISYKDIDEATKANLKNIAKANNRSVILSPRDANDSKIVLASWMRLEKLDSYDEVKILDFILRNKNKSPEPLAR
ncbi:DUF3105 domain-containing protein [Candidatus Nomurabacteria bacterium]|nr:DUF3105 domain-containing protein [Candidatus Nomurabacteria bacterium]